jgi:hypothetical protein
VGVLFQTPASLAQERYVTISLPCFLTRFRQEVFDRTGVRASKTGKIVGIGLRFPELLGRCLQLRSEIPILIHDPPPVLAKVLNNKAGIFKRPDERITGYFCKFLHYRDAAMTLTTNQREQLYEALLSAFDSRDVLERMVRLDLGETLEKIATGNLRKVVFDLLEWAEREGRMEDLIRGAYKFNPGNPQLRTFAAENSDAVAVASSEDGNFSGISTTCDPGEAVVTGLQVLANLLGPYPYLKQVLKPYRDEFHRIHLQIDDLACCKRVHDRLHDIQLRGYEPILRDVKKVSVGIDQSGNLPIYVGFLEMPTAQLTLLAVEAHPPELDLSWVGALTEVLLIFDKALAETSDKHLRQAIGALNRILTSKPCHVNEVLIGKAKGLPLPRLEGILTVVSERLTNEESSLAPSLPGELAPYHEGVRAFPAFRERIRGLLEEHNVWQNVDRDLRLIQATLPSSMEDLAEGWPHVFAQATSRYEKLAGGGACWRAVSRVPDVSPPTSSSQQQDPGATRMAEHADQLSELLEALKGIDPAEYPRQVQEKIRPEFHRFRREMTLRFHEVDTALLADCERLKMIGDLLPDDAN